MSKLNVILCKYVRTYFLCLVVFQCADVNFSTARDNSSENLSRQLHRNVDDYQRTVIEGGLMGVFTGAIAGAAVSLVTGDTRNIGRNVAIGAAAGGIFGIADGLNVAEKKKAYVKKEDELGAIIAKAREQNTKLRSIVHTADALVAHYRSELSQLSQSKLATEADKEKLRSDINGDASIIDSAVDQARQKRDNVKSILDQYKGRGNEAPLETVVNQNVAAADALSRDSKTLKDMARS